MAEHTNTRDERTEKTPPLRSSTWSRLASLWPERRRRTWDSLTPEQQADAANHAFRGNL